MTQDHAERILNLCEIPFNHDTNRSLRVFNSIVFFPNSESFYDKELKNSGIGITPLLIHIRQTQELNESQGIAITIILAELLS